MEALLQNATYIADVQERDGTSKQLALEVEKEGADRALYGKKREKKEQEKETAWSVQGD